jgi:hypothetical protein
MNVEYNGKVSTEKNIFPKGTKINILLFNLHNGSNSSLQLIQHDKAQGQEERGSKRLCIFY